MKKKMIFSLIKNDLIQKFIKKMSNLSPNTQNSSASISDALVNITHTPLIPFENSLKDLSKVQDKSLTIIKQAEPMELEELKATMEKTKRYIKKIQEIQSQMKQCNDLLTKIKKNSAYLPKAK